MNELEKIKYENEILKKRLKIAENWMSREVKAQVHKISKKQVSRFSEEVKESFLKENIEEVISNMINTYF